MCVLRNQPSALIGGFSCVIFSFSASAAALTAQPVITVTREANAPMP